VHCGFCRPPVHLPTARRRRTARAGASASGQVLEAGTDGEDTPAPDRCLTCQLAGHLSVGRALRRAGRHRLRHGRSVVKRQHRESSCAERFPPCCREPRFSPLLRAASWRRCCRLLAGRIPNQFRPPALACGAITRRMVALAVDCVSPRCRRTSTPRPRRCWIASHFAGRGAKARCCGALRFLNFQQAGVRHEALISAWALSNRALTRS
jgi:hypothetical protein